MDLVLREQYARMINNAAEATIRPVTVSVALFQEMNGLNLWKSLHAGISTTYSNAKGNAAVQGKNTQLGL